jgi:glucan phosphoethanolaminetransferase (alkaline phosphatase superfamily)
MKIGITLLLLLLLVLALASLLMSALGISMGVRVGGNMFVEETASVGAIYLVPLILLTCGGLYLVWRNGRTPR